MLLSGIAGCISAQSASCPECGPLTLKGNELTLSEGEDTVGLSHIRLAAILVLMCSTGPRPGDG